MNYQKYTTTTNTHHQNDVYTTVKPYSTWQGKVLAVVMSLIAWGLINWVAGL